MTDPLIIDPPVSAFSPIDDIEKWIDELKKMDQSDERDNCLYDANRWFRDHPDAAS